ncbi:MAG: ABC transporter permease, partial [Candidatus Latescibacteria bacterium]|nr:ABC transporter permease [Candidatus Latescibacterota bacterium]
MKVVFLLACRNLASRKPRTLLTILGVALGMATAVAVFVLDYNTILTMKFRELSKYGTPDVEIVPVTSGSSDFAAAHRFLAQKPYVVRSTPLFFKNLFLALKSRQEGLEVAALEPDAGEWFSGYAVASGGINLRDDGIADLLLNERFAEKHGISVGDTVRFLERSDVPFQVTGLLRHWKLGSRNNGNFAIIPFQTGLDVFSIINVTPFLWVKTDGSHSVEDMRSDLGYDYAVTQPPHVLAGETGDEKVMRDGVRISGLLTLCLGLYLVLTSLTMAVAERIREIGLMQAIGTTGRQILAIFTIEAGLISIAGTLLGLIGGIALAYGLSRLGFSSIGTGLWLWTFRLPLERIV